MFKFLVFYLFVLSCSNWFLKTQGSYDEPVVATPHIWNGENANIAKWPFMASIRGNDSGQLHSCGAVVLNDDTAITAAHCLQGANGEDDKPESRFLYLGQDTLDPVDNSSIYIPRKFIIHPQYVNQSGDDIALIKLSRKIDFKSAKGRIGKICLPSPDTKPDGSNCVALGWGYTEPNKDTKGVLQQVKLPLVKCNTARQRILCAGYIDRPDGICFGDSGGPLVCPPKDKPNTYLLYGLSAILFAECGKAPGGFTRVADFLNWIKENAEA